MRKTTIIITLFALVAALGLSAATATAADQTRDQLRQQLRDRIDAAQQLTAEQRTQMRENLEACLRLGLSDQEIGPLFPGDGQGREMSGEAMLRIQNRVRTAAQEGLPVGLMVAKVNEGRTKGVADPALERVCERVENNLRAAHGVMERAREMVQRREDPEQERRMEREMAQQMWRGMHEGDYDALLERARKRLRDGSCNVDDVVAAGEVAARLQGQGVGRERALEVSGEALEKGYRSREMRYLQFMVTARHRNGAAADFVGDLEYCLGMGMALEQMYQHMMQHGWMGPGEMWSPGGYHPIDDTGHGPGDGGHHGDGSGGTGGGGSDGGHKGNK